MDNVLNSHFSLHTSSAELPDRALKAPRALAVLGNVCEFQISMPTEIGSSCANVCLISWSSQRGDISISLSVRVCVCECVVLCAILFKIFAHVRRIMRKLAF